ncbi:MAG TPA: hypothetical protein VL547_13940 [Dinghuibacter sp.]|uniref:hypothetical protein n=1 Tax=Dinghuibacter sp. TaxID=2024697 RepID=UPI002BFAD207|nr:hypothetical protein [Dinghuibacter sp.]HTJ13130.1 hypothetical protein [Dinghuibacter sp.]
MKSHLILVFALFTTGSFAQVIHFDTKWRFIKGDDTAYKSEAFDDGKWELRLVPSSNKGWEGLCWYRVKFNVPRQMIGKEMVLFAGTIDAADETFVNGDLVGASGKIYPKVETAWDRQRIYTIPAGIVKENNTLAVRMFNATAIGGIYKGRLALMTKDTYEKEKKELAATRRSYFQLTTSNGLISAVYNTETDRVETLYPHIFAYYDSAKFVSPVAFNISFKKPMRPLSAHYLDNTHVIEVKYRDLSVYYFAPFTTHESILYAVVKGPPEAVKSIAFGYDRGKGEIQTSDYAKIRNGVAEKYFLFGFTDSLHKDAAICRKAKTRLAGKNTSLLSEEIQFMHSVFKGCKIPGKATADEKALLQQSVTILKMSQVPEQEILPCARGQIVASLRPGEWSMTWVRDGSFAIAAMAKLGMNDEARRGLEFMLNARPVGRFKNNVFRNGRDYGIGVDYRISATRYYGNSKEDCDASEGPTIEIDDFGLFLTALDEYMKSSNDGAFYRQWEKVLSEKVADAIIHNIDGDGLIRSDSGPWEHPLPGRRYTFTSGVCAEGLKRFSAMQKRYGYEWKKYSTASERLYAGIMSHMVYENRVIKGDADDQSPTAHYFHDAGTFELFANGLITDKKLFESHMREYDPLMKVKDGIGYIRVFSDDSYENQEWPFADLRVAVAQNHLGSRSLAKGLIDKVTALSKANYNSIPEMYMLDNCYFNGAVPMVGYGSGAYVLALLDYYGCVPRR